MLFSKRFKPLEEYDDTWKASQGEYNGSPIFIRIRESIKEAVGHPDYPFQIGVATPLIHPGDDGLPAQDESDELLKIEDKLEEVFSNDAVFVLSISTSGMRELVFYSKEWKPEELEQKVKDTNELFPSRELQFIMQHDPKWKAFKSFL